MNENESTILFLLRHHLYRDRELSTVITLIKTFYKWFVSWLINDVRRLRQYISECSLQLKTSLEGFGPPFRVVHEWSSLSISSVNIYGAYITRGFSHIKTCVHKIHIHTGRISAELSLEALWSHFSDLHFRLFTFLPVGKTGWTNNACNMEQWNESYLCHFYYLLIVIVFK